MSDPSNVATAPAGRPATVRLVALACLAQVLTMLGVSAFAALLPQFREAWALSNTEAGWIGSVLLAGYVVAVPLLVTLTDRVDPKRIYLVGVAVAAIGNVGFAVFADGFWSAMVFRGLAGAGLAGTYMPGLKALADHVDPRHQSRATAVYVSGFGLGAALSYPYAGYVAAWTGWPAAFAGAGLAALVAGAIVALAVPRSAPQQMRADEASLLDLRPILANRSVMAYTLCYALHNWELFALRAWVVAYLTFTEGLHGAATGVLAPTVVAAVVTIVGMPASILGNEVSMRRGRRRTVALVMAGSAAMCWAVGFSSAISYLLVAALCLVHGVTALGESASVTAGVLGNAPPGYRGATMALHSTIGFTGAALGPLAFGWVLDLAGSGNGMAWGLAFGHMGLVVLAGPLLLALLRPAGLPGDRS